MAGTPTSTTSSTTAADTRWASPLTSGHADGRAGPRARSFARPASGASYARPHRRRQVQWQPRCRRCRRPGQDPGQTAGRSRLRAVAHGNREEQRTMSCRARFNVSVSSTIDRPTALSQRVCTSSQSLPNNNITSLMLAWQSRHAAHGKPVQVMGCEAWSTSIDTSGLCVPSEPVLMCCALQSLLR
jgi:hypothetical protein